MKNSFSLKGQTAVITGASGNLGPVWIGALLNAGADVLAIDMPKQVSAGIRKRIKPAPRRRFVYAEADVRDRASLERACSLCLRKFGPPSILVNNAGIDSPPRKAGKGYRLECLPLRQSRRILEVNLLGLFQVIQIFGREMVKAGRGSIINIGSLYAGVSPDARFYEHIPLDPPFLKHPAYGASKAAVVNLTRYLATLWAPCGVRVNALSPGGVLGGQDPEFKRKFCERVPLGRMASPEDLGGPLVFLASSASAYITGTELLVDGGFTAW